jgi:branched-chain amino acid transport system permease protein
VRFISFMIAGFFAGVAGGLYTLNFEIVTAEVVSAYKSGAYLLFTFLGGALFFFGPIIGAVLMVIATVLLSEWTKAWLLYLGLIFLFMVMYAPGGVASLLMMNVRVAAYGMLRKLWTAYLALFGSAAVTMLGVTVMVEMLYHIKLNEALGPHMNMLGVMLDTRGLDSWVGAALLVLTGGVLFDLVRREFSRQWEQVQEDIEAETHRRAAAH